jgi:hypothetical protein
MEEERVEIWVISGYYGTMVSPIAERLKEK